MESTHAERRTWWRTPLAAYGLMIVGTVAAFFLIRLYGETLVATKPAVTAERTPGPTTGHVLFHVLLVLAAVIAVGRVLSWLFRLIGQPPVIGEVVAGILLGPSVLGAIWPEAVAFLLPADIVPPLSVIAQLGVILYMFCVGLELDPALLAKRGSATMAISHASIIAPFLLGILIAIGLYPRFATQDVTFTVYALFIGTAMSVTAFPVLARILADCGITRTPLGTMALTCAAADDATAWCLLAVVVGVAQAQLSSAILVVVLAIGYVLLMFFAVQPLLRRWTSHLDAASLPPSAIATILLLLLFSALTTELIGIHAIFGAFLLGAIMPHDGRVAHEMNVRIESLVTMLLLPAFFALTGMRTELALLHSVGDWFWCGVIIAAASVGKIGGTIAAARINNLPWRDSASLGVLMNTRGLMGLIVLNIGLDLGIIGPKVFAMMVVMALVTTLATTPLLRLFAKPPMAVAMVFVALLAASSPLAAADRPPNFVLIFMDDMGYGDLGCYGGKRGPTPRIDQMAAEGMRFTDFHCSAAVCSSSRASILTGCYCQRVSVLGAWGPRGRTGIHPDEVLIPEILKSKEYATAIFGKWHLGHLPEFLPPRNGFDEYFGLPYSNDMGPIDESRKTQPPIPLIEGEKTIAENPDQNQLTTQYTERAVKFIETHKDRPFFLYLPHTMVHVPLGVSDKYRGKSGVDTYGDVLMEVDWSVGEVFDALERNGVEDNTLVFFTSDNGPWLPYGNHAGTAGPLREGKGTTWEGGQRVPGIARWPGKIPAGKVCDEFATTMDLLPTIAKLAGAEVPTDRIVDGLDIWPLLAGEPNAKSPYDVFYYYWLQNLEAVRTGPWKLVFPHKYRKFTGGGSDGGRAPDGQAQTELALYNLADDIGETKNVAAEHPEIVEKLQALAEKARDDLGDGLTNRIGKNVRPHGVAK